MDTKKAVGIMALVAVLGFTLGAIIHTATPLGDVLSLGGSLGHALGGTPANFGLTVALVSLVITMIGSPGIREEFSGSRNMGRDYRSASRKGGGRRGRS